MWFQHAFGLLYPVIYAHRSVESAKPEAEFAARCLGLAPGNRVLDIACGTGRHLVHLREHTREAVGLDYSEELLHLARTGTVPGGWFVLGDMRNLPFSAAMFDAATNFFTSFGYFFPEEENFAVLQNMARVLKPGGRFFIDHINREHAEKTLTPESKRRSGLYRIVDERWIAENRVNKRTKVYLNGNCVSQFEESVQLYAPEQFASLLAQAGLEAEALYGNYEASPLSPDEPRMIATGRKA